MKTLISAAVLFVAFSVVTGLVYPFAVTGVAQVLFPEQAGGSVVRVDGRAVGSRLVGQPFDAPEYFWARPSATPEHPYLAAASSGSNLGPTNVALRTQLEERVAALRAAHPGASGPVPVDLVTASGSGLDPHVTPAAAFFQVGRVARARAVPPAEVRALVERHVEDRQLGWLGEPRVNVLELNLALDALASDG